MAAKTIDSFMAEQERAIEKLRVQLAKTIGKPQIAHDLRLKEAASLVDEQKARVAELEKEKKAAAQRFDDEIKRAGERLARHESDLDQLKRVPVEPAPPAPTTPPTPEAGRPPGTPPLIAKRAARKAAKPAR